MLKNKSNTMLTVEFGDEALKELQSFYESARIANKEQTDIDLKRISSLKIKDNEGINWSHSKDGELYVNSQASIDHLNTIEGDPIDKFFNRIKILDRELQRFIEQHCHQGGILFCGRAFLSYYINSLGFQINGDHSFIFEVDSEDSKKLTVNETVFLKKLTYLPIDNIVKTVSKNGTLSPLDLEKASLEKIAYFRETIKNSLEELCQKGLPLGWTENSEMRLDENPKSGNYLHMVREPEQLYQASESLIEFTVKHTVTLDVTAPQGIRIKKLSGEDIKLEVQPQLYALSASATNKPEFSRLLLPDLPLSAYKNSSFFTKPTFKNKVKRLIITSYHEFVIFLLTIVAIFLAPAPYQPHLFTLAKAPEYYRDNFAYRLRP